MTDPDSVEAFFTAVEADLGPVTVVVNNAAMARYGPLDDFSPEEIEAEVATKLLGSLSMARRGIQTMRAGVPMFRCGETGGTDFATREIGGTDFATREIGGERMTAASERWFRRGLLRHGGVMTPEMVADAVAGAVTLPFGYQYETLAVIPTAPIGDLPTTFAEFVETMMRMDMPDLAGEDLR